MGNNKITGLANGTLATDGTALGQVQSAASQAATTSGTNTILLTVSPTVLAYAAGQVFRFVAANTNTAACTINVDSVGASNLYKRMSGGLVALVANDLIANVAYEIVYDGTQFELIGQAPYTQGANVASATTTVLDTTTGDYIHITGTTTITAITLAQGAERSIVFDGILTLTNGASLILPSGANITTAAGDTAVFRGEASAVVRCVSYIRASGNALVGSAIGAAPITNSLSGDVAMNSAAYFTGPSVAQGSVGTWFASGTITIVNNSGAQIDAKLWDGTTVIASASALMPNVGSTWISISLSGFLATPAGNLRISAMPVAGTAGSIAFNASGNSKDSTITAFRIA